MVDIGGQDGAEVIHFMKMPERVFFQGAWLCKILGHKFWKKPQAIRNNDGSVAYMAKCCTRWDCHYREPITEEGRRMRNADRERIGAYMNGERASLGLAPLNPKTWV